MRRYTQRREGVADHDETAGQENLRGLTALLGIVDRPLHGFFNRARDVDAVLRKGGYPLCPGVGERALHRYHVVHRHRHVLAVCGITLPEGHVGGEDDMFKVKRRLETGQDIQQMRAVAAIGAVEHEDARGILLLLAAKPLGAHLETLGGMGTIQIVGQVVARQLICVLGTAHLETLATTGPDNLLETLQEAGRDILWKMLATAPLEPGPAQFDGRQRVVFLVDTGQTNLNVRQTVNVFRVQETQRRLYTLA